MVRRVFWLTCCALGALAALRWDAAAETIEEFYKGRVMKLVVGANTGGSYDSYGRLLAAHMGRHMPGSPTIVVENMPGASGIRAAAWLAQVAPKDGSVVAVFNQSIAQRQMLEPDQVRFDVRQLNWIGAMGSSVTVSFVWHASGVRTLEDARKKEVVMGALGSDGGNAVFPLLYNKFLGTRFKVVTGYPGGNTIQLAMERGEVDGQGSFPWSGLKAGWPQWIAEKKINVLIQLGLRKDPELSDVPLLLDLAKTPTEQAIFRFISSDTVMGAPVVAPPGVPPERVAALRKGFEATMTDPAFLAEAAQRKQPIQITTGEEVQSIVASLIATPADVMDSLKQALADARQEVTEKVK